MQVAEFRRRFPLGSTNKVVLTDQADRYFGIVETAKAFDASVVDDEAIGNLAILRETALLPAQDVGEAMKMFDLSEADYLAVVDDEGHVLGTLSERFVHRRYADEVEKAQREIFGE
jgi:CIC family chloride channel protein